MGGTHHSQMGYEGLLFVYFSMECYQRGPTLPLFLALCHILQLNIHMDFGREGGH